MILVRLLPIASIVALTACSSSDAELGASEARLQSATTIRDVSDEFTVRDGILYRVAGCLSWECRGVARSGTLVFGPVDHPEADQRASDLYMGYGNTELITTSTHVYVAGDSNIFRMPLGGGPVEDLGPYDNRFARFAVDGDKLFHFHAWGIAKLRHISSTTPWTTVYSAPSVDGTRNDVIDTTGIVPRANGQFFGLHDYEGPYSLDPATNDLKFLAPLHWRSAWCPGVSGVGSPIQDMVSMPGGLLVLCNTQLVSFDPSGASPPKILGVNPETDNRGTTRAMKQGIEVENGFAYTQSVGGAVLKTNLATATIEVIVPGTSSASTWRKTISLDGSYLYFRRAEDIQRVSL